MWVLFTIISAFIYSIVSLVDKIAVSKEMRDPIFATTIFGIIMFLVFGTIGFFVDVRMPYPILVIILLAGILSWFGAYLYYKVLVKEDVSKFASILSVSPIFVMILAYFLLGEVFGPLKYFGIFLIVVGAAVISLKEFRFKLGLKVSLLLISLAILLFALGNIAVKFSTLHVSIWPIMFWIGIAEGIVSLLAFMIHHPHIRGKVKEKGVNHLILANVLTVVGAVFGFLAISLGPVTLVRALGEVYLLFVFFGALLMGKFYPKILKEKSNGRIVLQKIVAIVLILAGSVLII